MDRRTRTFQPRAALRVLGLVSILLVLAGCVTGSYHVVAPADMAEAARAALLQP